MSRLPILSGIIGVGLTRGGTDGATTSFFGYTVSPIPEPETYAMFLAGLGMMAVMAHRRKA